MNYLYSALAFIAILIGAEQYGEHRVQVEWDKDKAARQSILDQSIKQNKEALNALKTQYEKDKSAATSKAGRDAVARYLRDHGLLSGCVQVPNTGTAPTQSVEGTNGTSSQSGTSESIEEFGVGCAKDALKVMRWQELCIRMNCEVY